MVRWHLDQCVPYTNDNEIRRFFREVFFERYKIDLSKKEDDKGSQYVVVEVPKGVGFTRKGSTSLENYAVHTLLSQLSLSSWAKVCCLDKIGIGIWYRAQGALIEEFLPREA